MTRESPSTSTRKAFRRPKRPSLLRSRSTWKHVPLRRTLQLLLGQLGLVYFVDDGILCITSQESERTKFDPSMIEHTPFMEKREKAERGELDRG